MHRPLALVLLAAALCLSSGCASLVTPGRFRPVKVETRPEGADVYLNDAFEGRTPLTLRVDRRAEHRLRVALAGKEPLRETIHAGFNGWYLFNVLSWGVPGFLIDGFNGSIWEPKPGKFDLYLLPPGGDYGDRQQQKDAKRAWKDGRKARKEAERAGRAEAASPPPPAAREETPPEHRVAEPAAASPNPPPGDGHDPLRFDFYGPPPR